MLQAVEAEISPDGRVTLLESVHVQQTRRAILTILLPTNVAAQVKGRGAALLEVLDSPAFAAALPGDPARLEREIAANRDAWG
jgi:hypothetical protein